MYCYTQAFSISVNRTNGPERRCIEVAPKHLHSPALRHTQTQQIPKSITRNVKGHKRNTVKFFQSGRHGPDRCRITKHSGLSNSTFTDVLISYGYFVCLLQTRYLGRTTNQRGITFRYLFQLLVPLYVFWCLVSYNG
jgi:hypothetical protein